MLEKGREYGNTDNFNVVWVLNKIFSFNHGIRFSYNLFDSEHVEERFSYEIRRLQVCYSNYDILLRTVDWLIQKGILHNFEIFSSIFTERMNKFLSLSDCHWRRIFSNLVPIRMMKIRQYWKDSTLLVHVIAWLVTIIASKLSWTKTCKDVCN